MMTEKYRCRKGRKRCIARRRRVRGIIVWYHLDGFLFYTQKFDNRALVVHQTEEPCWKQLSIEYMSEESDDESEPLAVVHQPEWRSKRNMYILFV